MPADLLVGLIQFNLAAGEIMQIDKQIAAANIRLAIAQQELTVHLQQVQNSQDTLAFLQSKYTNQELYGWLVSDVSATYFQAYQIAYDLAKKAERCYRYERGLTSSSFIQFGYWDSLRKGLQAGERLALALRHLERAYQDQNQREYEITKNISLQLIDPLALITLKQTVCGNSAATLTMRTGVRQKDTIAPLKKYRSESGHAFTIATRHESSRCSAVNTPRTPTMATRAS